jgi:ubiquinone/menaquinone biosynthesis C-methylase UbiE
MIRFDYSILRCPVTQESLQLLSREDTILIMRNYDREFLKIENITAGFTNISASYFYPVFEDVVLLLPVYALFIGKGNDLRGKMVFDKQRVFEYYNQISYNTKSDLKIYEDSAKWVDFREVTGEYIRKSFTRAGQYLNTNGKYILDIASGPIGLKEYVDLSDNFQIRICADISVNALVQAKYNYRHRPGIFICADITNIPLQNDICDSVLCQHTLYHVPRNEQKTAVNEMYRVAKPGSAIVIVYSLFYHSWFMNVTLLPVQIYRITRHLAGKLYVRLLTSKPRLYFYPHSLRWFKTNFSFSDKIQFYCWRSANKYFLNLYIHKWLAGKKVLRALMKSEDKHPVFWAKLGEYPLICIRK